MATLPTEIFTHHIFLKLPVKSLLLFKGVCRQWNHLLCDPQFARMHLHHATQLGYPHKLLIQTYSLKKIYSLDLDHQTIRSDGGDDHGYAVMLKFPLHDHPLQISRRILGSVNGLVCASVTYKEGVYNKTIILIWNPSTGDYKVLPPNPYTPIEQYDSIGFAYDSLADDYKIVHIVDGDNSQIDIYSLKANSWKLVLQDIPKNLPEHENHMILCSLDGSIYWLGIKNDVDYFFVLKEDDDKNLIIKELPPPRDRVVQARSTTDLKLFGGRLGIYQSLLFEKKVEMWTRMKKNKTNNEDDDDKYWTKKMTIDVSSLLNGVFHPMLTLYPICLFRDGKILLTIRNTTHHELVLYDPKTKSFKDFHIHYVCKIGSNLENTISTERPRLLQETEYIESLVSPNFLCR